MKKYPSEACSSNSRTLRRYVVVAGLVLSVGLTIAPGAVSTAYADELDPARALPPPSKPLYSLVKALLPVPLIPRRRRKGRQLPVLPKALLVLKARIRLNLPRLNRAPVKRALLVPANLTPLLLVKALLLLRLPATGSAPDPAASGGSTLAAVSATEGAAAPTAGVVAKIGEQSYATLDEAIAAAKSGDTIVLVANA